MKTVPPKYTAYQGFDALFHNTEVMISKGVNILSETIAQHSMEHAMSAYHHSLPHGAV